MLGQLIQASSKKFGLDFVLVNALIATESGFNPLVIRYEPDYKYLFEIEKCRKLIGCTLETMVNMQKTSWGLCQIMGANFYEMGGKNWATKLLDPEVNIVISREADGIVSYTDIHNIKQFVISNKMMFVYQFQPNNFIDYIISEIFDNTSPEFGNI
jgi:hypothetical protein